MGSAPGLLQPPIGRGKVFPLTVLARSFRDPPSLSGDRDIFGVDGNPPEQPRTGCAIKSVSF